MFFSCFCPFSFQGASGSYLKMRRISGLLAVTRRLLVGLLLLCSQLCYATHQRCQKSISIEDVLQTAKAPTCLMHQSTRSMTCTVLACLTQRAEKEGVALKSFIDRATIAVVTSEKLSTELMATWNTSLEDQVSQHLAFVGVVNCSDGDNAAFCEKLLDSCTESSHHTIFLVSAYCSETINCVPIGTHVELNGEPTLLPDIFSYLTFRLLERQLLIAKELGETHLSVSSDSEYLIQKEMQDSHSVGLLNDGKPVVLLITWLVKSVAYYHFLSMFLDVAISLREKFSFHVITKQLSRISKPSSRPLYRHELTEHQAALGLYTKQMCFSKADWAFSCKPAMVTEDLLLTAQQFSSFLLYQIVKEFGVTSASHELPLPFPAFVEHSVHLESLITHSDSYILAVFAKADDLTDPLQDWEKLMDLTAYLGALLNLTFYPVAVIKAVALDLLAKQNAGVELREKCESSLCFVVRLPGAGHEVLAVDDAVMKLEAAAEAARNQSTSYYENFLLSLSYIDNFDLAELPKNLTCGHFGVNHNMEIGHSSIGGAPELLPDNSRESLPDAFVEQSRFNEIYNLTGVLTINSSERLMNGFGEDKPWLVLFVVPWNPLCKAARAVWSEVDQCVKTLGLHDVQLVKVDCFEANELCSHLGIAAYPTVAMFKHGDRTSTYAGPITRGGLCAYASLVLMPDLLHSQSAQETSDLAAKFLPLISRVFIYSGWRLPDSVLTVSAQLRFREAFIFQQIPENEKNSEEFSVAYHDDSYPTSRQFEGNINDTAGLKDFIANSHLDGIFPCTWIYLAQALRSARPLIFLFHMCSLSDHLALLRHLHSQASTLGASVCHLKLKRLAHLDTLVQRIAGHSLPALVVLAQDRRTIYRLPLGSIPTDVLFSEASHWIDKGLSGQLTNGHRVDDPKPWEPCTQAYNFVDQVYHAKTSCQGVGSHGSRFGGRSFASDQGEDNQNGNIAENITEGKLQMTFDGDTGDQATKSIRSSDRPTVKKPAHEEL